MSPDQRQAHDVDHEPDAQDPPAAPQAVATKSRWPGWIWAVPIAALLIVGYLAAREFLQRGPLVTVTFASAGGVKAGDTKVQYQGLQVGEVESVTLQKDMHHVDVGLRLDSDMDGHLGPGTRFWIAGESPSFADLASLKTIISGPFIGIDPHPGGTQKHFQGLEATPAVKQTVAGTRYTLHATLLGTIGRSSGIFYRDFRVGTVEDTHLRPDGSGFDIDAFVAAPFDSLVHQESRFWNAGAVQVALAGPGPRVQFHSVPALFSGAIGIVPGAGGPAAGNGAQFTLYDSKDAAENAPGAGAVQYRAVFDAAGAEALDVGAPVQLAGKQVGSVQSSALVYQPNAGQLQLLVTLALEPRLITLGDGQRWQSDARPQMDALLRRLIGQGLRASLGKTIPAVGAPAVMLDFGAKEPPADLEAGDPPVIPSGASSGVDSIMASVGAFSAKLQSIPLDAIAEEVHRTTSRIAQLSDSPELTQSLQHLDQSLANVDRVTHEASTQVGPILARLHRVADEAQSAVAGAEKLLNANQLTPRQPGTAGFGDALYELSRAARSLRELADYLDRHPEALLRGKGGQG